MVKPRYVKDTSGTIDLIEHHSDLGLKLRQVETDRIYGASVVDAIPCRYSYVETDVKDESNEENITLEDTLSALAELGVKE